MNPGIEQENQAKLWLQKGESSLKNSNYEEALSFFEHAIATNPNDQEAWNKKASALQRLGRFNEAIEATNRAIILNNNNFLTTVNKINQTKINEIHKLLEIGTEKYQSDQWEEALTYFEKVIAINPENSSAWNCKGNILKRLGKLEEALNCFNETLKIKDNSASSWNDKGNVLSGLGRFEEALICYDKALKFSENKLWMAWLNRGIALLYTRGFKEAIANWNKAINQLDTRDKDYGKARGYLYWQKGKAFYFQAKEKSSQSVFKNNSYFSESIKSYQQALAQFNSCSLYLKSLEVLKDLWLLYHTLKDEKNEQKIFEQGNKLLIDLIQGAESQQFKLLLSKQFACFSNQKKNQLSRNKNT
jgi:tetratricopeptide (TPR) repeat protein